MSLNESLDSVPDTARRREVGVQQQLCELKHGRPAPPVQFVCWGSFPSAQAFMEGHDRVCDKSAGISPSLPVRRAIMATMSAFLCDRDSYSVIGSSSLSK